MIDKTFRINLLSQTDSLMLPASINYLDTRPDFSLSGNRANQGCVTSFQKVNASKLLSF